MFVEIPTRYLSVFIAIVRLRFAGLVHSTHGSPTPEFPGRGGIERSLREYGRPGHYRVRGSNASELPAGRGAARLNGERVNPWPS